MRQGATRMEKKDDGGLHKSIKTNGEGEANFRNCNHEKELTKLNEKIDGMTFNLVAVRYELGELKRNNLDTYALVQKMYSVVEALEHNITRMQSHPWKENMNSSSKDVQNGTNESSGQNFVGKGDEFGVKIAKIKDKTEDACDENLSLKNLFAYRKLKENQIFHNVVKKDKAMDAVDFVDLVSSVEVDAVEDKKVRPRKPSRYKKSPYENFTKKKGRRNKEFGLSKHGASFSEEEWYILQYIFHEQLDKREKIVMTKRHIVTRFLMSSLAPNVWIFDEIISCYAEYLTRKESLKQDYETRNWFLPILFGQIVANVSGVSTIDRSEIEISVRKHNICEFYMGALKRCEKIYVPLYDGLAKHWYLAIMNIKDKTAEIWDSLPNSEIELNHRQEIVKQNLHALDLVLYRDIAFNFPSDWYFADFDILYPNNVPIQPNGNDCGLYVMKFMETPCEMLFPTYKYESDEERFRLTLLLVNGDANEVRDSVIQKALSFRGPKTNVIATSKVRTKVASQKKNRSINKVRTVIGTGEYLKKPGRKSN